MSVLVKAAHVIDVLNRSTTPTKLGTIAEEVGVPKSSAHRLLAELAALGVVRKVEDGGYTVGYRLIQWGHDAELALSIRSVAEPLMRQLSETICESVQFYVPEGSHRICVASVPGPQTLRPFMHPGKILPLGAGASGKLLLAFAKPHVRVRARQLAAEDLEARWPDETELGLIRERGWATSTGEMEDGLTAVAAAVLTRSGDDALGALTVAGATTRLPSERCRELRPSIVRVAEEIARAIGA